jgi:hypothetical protein
MQKRYPNLNVEIYDNCVDKLLGKMTPEDFENEGSESGLSLISEDDDEDDAEAKHLKAPTTGSRNENVTAAGRI